MLRSVRDAPVRFRYALNYPLNYVLYADSPTVKVIGHSKPFETMVHARDSEPDADICLSHNRSGYRLVHLMRRRLWSGHLYTF